MRPVASALPNLDVADLHAGTAMYELAKQLWPICRSLSGDGVRETLQQLRAELPALQLHEVASGTKCFDWEVPDEWNIRDAYIITPDGRKIADFKRNNLHVVGYSIPVDTEMSFEDLRPHLFSLPAQPTAIPYVTSYYSRFWGFCLSDEELRGLGPGRYRVVVDSTLEKGHLTYGDLVLRGDTNEEVLLSTYVCHPSMANNELSGPVVACALAKWLASLPSRRYTYRIFFGVETIGAIVNLSRNWEAMRRTKAGWVLTCVGDERTYSFLPSRTGQTMADRISRHVLRHRVPSFKEYSFLDRGSDERQYCSPGADLPVCSVMRSKYAEYPEYHTSLDDLSLISPLGLAGTYSILKDCITLLEANHRYRTRHPGEPQLGKRGLYPSLSTKDSTRQVKTMMDFLAYCDGDHDLIQIAERIEAYAGDLVPLAQRLSVADVIVSSPGSAPC